MDTCGSKVDLDKAQSPATAVASWKADEKGSCCVQEGVRGECPAYGLREAALFGLGLAVLLSPALGSALRDHSERGGLLGSRAVRLAFSRAVDAAEADAFRVLVVEDFDGVAVEDGDDWAGKVRINYKLGR